MENQTPRIIANVSDATRTLTASLGDNSPTLEAQAYANALILEGVSPYIGNDGYWYRYDVDTRAYVNTNVKAQGAQGPAGQNGRDGSNYVITQADYEDIADLAADRITVPVATSQLLNDAGFITNAYHDSSKSDVEHTHSQYLTEHQDISGKADVGHEHQVADISDFPSIPTDTIELANTAGYITIDSVPTDSHINDLIDAKLGVIENGSY